MQIVQRHNKYFLQFDNAELELSEQQVQKRLSRGDKVLNQLQALHSEIPEIDTNVTINKPNQEKKSSLSDNSYASAKYFDYILHEFEQIYRANSDDPQAIAKLKRFCKNSIQKLDRDRKSPKTDHVVIDYYLLSWNRVIDFLDALPEKLKEEQERKFNTIERTAEIAKEENGVSVPVISKDYTKQLLIIQLMQAEGIFPINNALEGVTQTDIQKLIAGILGVDERHTLQALHNASSILLKRDITSDNLQERIKTLEEVEAHFEELPYTNIISRVKLLLKIYREKLPR